jgi:peptide/nickel transport system substrate-binding protein
VWNLKKGNKTVKMNNLNSHLRLLSAGAALSILLMAAPAAFAETPKDTLVEGFAIDDIITMDPGEAFELSTACPMMA